jgi:hypothetical protein
VSNDGIEYPPGYLDAWAKYLLKFPQGDTDPEPDSLQDIWEQVSLWRDYEQGFPKLKKRLSSYHDEAYRRDCAEEVEKFKARVGCAILEGDLGFLETLFKASGLKELPRPPLNGITAALDAFEQLFIEPGYSSRDEWPTKQEVRRRVEELLRAAGQSLPGERQWPRIFKSAGLSELFSVTFGRARKRKKRTKSALT